jgi:hypothetical protein
VDPSVDDDVRVVLVLVLVQPAEWHDDGAANLRVVR